MSRLVLVITLLAMLGFFALTLLSSPQFFLSAFNVVSSNLGLAALAVVAL